MYNHKSSAKARNIFPELVNQATYAKKRIVITRRGKKVAAIIPIEDLEYLEAIEESEDIKLIEKVLKNESFEDWEDACKQILKHFDVD